jgi:dipeptidase E
MKHIIAIGGGGFTLDLEDLTIDRYVLAQAWRKRPRIAYVSTAAGDSDATIVRFHDAFGRLDCRPTHLPFFKRTPELRKVLLAQDVIYVGPGNTKSMLAIWRDWGMVEVLREAWERGIVLAGTSAGSICWFEQGVTDSYADRLRAIECMGFLKGSCCPHYDGEAERAPAFRRMVLRGEVMDGIAIDDHAAVHFAGENVRRVIAGRKGAGAYRVAKRGKRIVSETLRT